MPLFFLKKFFQKKTTKIVKIGTLINEKA